MPVWLDWALTQIGQKEEPENRGPYIQKLVNLAKCGKQGDPWCAIFVNAALETNEIKGTRSASSQSFRTNSNFVPLPGPAKGALAVFWRQSPTAGIGHVGFYVGEHGSTLYILGGNEQDRVEIEGLPRNSSNFGLIGYWWPKTVVLPEIGPIAYTGNSQPSTQVT